MDGQADKEHLYLSFKHERVIEVVTRSWCEAADLLAVAPYARRLDRQEGRASRTTDALPYGRTTVLNNPSETFFQSWALTLRKSMSQRTVLWSLLEKVKWS